MKCKHHKYVLPIRIPVAKNRWDFENFVILQNPKNEELWLELYNTARIIGKPKYALKFFNLAMLNNRLDNFLYAFCTPLF